MNLLSHRRFGPFREVFRTIWANRMRPRYAWRILNDGVCDGCALGTSGMRDWTLDGTHLCWIRLNLLRTNTMGGLDPKTLADVSRLRRLSESELRALGRLPMPFLRRAGEPGFSPVSWEEALTLAAEKVARVDPRRLAFYVVSRGTVNETYYAAQKVARFLGTNHVDNSSRVCHSPSTTGLKQSIGYAATTCSYTDLIGADWIVFLGSDVANNQPVMMKYLHLAKKAGTRVAMINPYREPGMEKYWIPSTFESAVQGTEFVDEFVQIRVGGDIAFLNGVLKHLLDADAIDRAFLAGHTTGWDAVEAAVRAQNWETLEAESGVSRADMVRFAETYAGHRNVIFVWSMGITMHRHGVDNVQAIVNLALARGMIGRPHTGLMPIRGHSGVQGGAEMGCVPDVLPGGHAVDSEGAAALSEAWGFPVPAWRGMYAADMVEAAHRGELDVLYAVGSNLLAILPDRDTTAQALARIPFRVHHDIVMNPQMLVDPGEAVLLLPATTRYEMPGGGTETSTERRVIFNPFIPGSQVLGAQEEWRVLTELAARARPQQARKIRFDGTRGIREEIARLIPQYRGIEKLRAKGDQFQWGGERLAEGGRFGFPDGRARLSPVQPPSTRLPEGSFHLNTRRGKQFNSMVFGEKDMISGAGRDAVLVARSDLERLGLAEGDAVVVHSGTGSLAARIFTADLTPGTAMMFWPEANVLIPRGVTEPRSGIPAYRDAVVEIRTGSAEAAR